MDPVSSLLPKSTHAAQPQLPHIDPTPAMSDSVDLPEHLCLCTCSPVFPLLKCPPRHSLLTHTSVNLLLVPPEPTQQVQGAQCLPSTQGMTSTLPVPFMCNRLCLLLPLSWKLLRTGIISMLISVFSGPSKVPNTYQSLANISE